MDLEFFQKVKQTYEDETYDIRDLADVSTQLNNDLVRFKASNDKENRVRQETCKIEAQIKEVEDLINTQSLDLGELESKLKETQLEIKNLNDLKKKYLYRSAKARASLSNNDKLFIKSIEKRLKAYRHLTGIVWSKCNADQVEGCIVDLVSHRTKFFSMHPDPDKLWQIIEDLTE